MVLGLKGKYGKYEVNRAYVKLADKLTRECRSTSGNADTELTMARMSRDCLLHYVSAYHIVSAEKRHFFRSFLDEVLPWRSRTRKEFSIPRGPSRY